MKAIILAGGYAKRLWPLTKYTPKPLLDINGKPMLDIIVEKMESIEEIDEIIVSTNEKFKGPFYDWIKEKHDFKKKLKLIVEPTFEEKGKFGTVAGIQYVIEQEKINDDVMIIAGDNLFDADLDDFISYYKEKKTPIISVFDIKDRHKAQIYGIVSIDSDNKIIGFEEKPEDPPSTLAATCCYLFSKDILKKIKMYLDDGNRSDAPGYFIKWLSSKIPVHAFVFDGHWFDIGDFESLEKAREFMKMHGV
jgi:glucose-1-phosphate thymidylyltransferase